MANFSTDKNTTIQPADESHSLPLRAERLHVATQRTQSAEVYLHKKVVKEQFAIDVSVTYEEVHIQRRPINDRRLVTYPITQDETIRIPVLAEQVMVTKISVETGEIVVRKRAVQANQLVTDTVRHEEARLDQQGNVRVNAEDDLLNT